LPRYLIILHFAHPQTFGYQGKNPLPAVSNAAAPPGNKAAK
jgi:hypothetical protein